MNDHISFEFAIYYLPQPSQEPLAQLDQMLRRQKTEFRRVEKVDHREKTPQVAARLETNPQQTYAPPDLDSMQYFGRGVSREQAQALQSTQSVLILDFSYSKEHVWTGMRSALELTHELALSTGGLVWDEATREVFSPDKWEEQRLRDWTETVPDISKHTVIHAYKKEEYVRAITLGMEKFGLPDVVIDDFSWSLNRNMGHIINLFAQSLAEGAVISRPGEFDLNLREIKNSKVRDPQLASLKPNATGLAPLTIREGTWEDGDPNNRLISITFDRASGPDIHAKQVQAISASFGWEDSIVQVQHDQELKAASERARAKLPQLRDIFNNGLAPGEFIQVKAPFATPDGGQEWMWVEVNSWKGDRISGLLKNEPFNIPDLHGGQIVEVSESKVFDYIRRRPDGTSEGNETSKLIEKQGK